MNKLQHEKWLRKMGAHPDQIKAKKPKGKQKYEPTIKVAHSYYGGLSNTVAPPVLSNSIWDKLDGETPETIQEIKRKASLCGAPYSKGANQYVGTNKENIKIMGKKL